MSAIMYIILGTMCGGFFVVVAAACYRLGYMAHAREQRIQLLKLMETVNTWLIEKHSEEAEKVLDFARGILQSGR
jgi:organic hydroperoxide reductase OsmC/OhrA